MTETTVDQIKPRDLNQNVNTEPFCAAISKNWYHATRSVSLVLQGCGIRSGFQFLTDLVSQSEFK